MINNPLRCSTPMCAFYAVVEGGMCAECEADAFADAEFEAEWIEWNHRQAEIEAQEAIWAAEDDAEYFEPHDIDYSWDSDMPGSW